MGSDKEEVRDSSPRRPTPSPQVSGLYLVSDRRFGIRFGARAASGSKSALPDVLPEKQKSRSLERKGPGRTLAPTQPARDSGSPLTSTADYLPVMLDEVGLLPGLVT